MANANLQRLITQLNTSGIQQSNAPLYQVIKQLINFVLTFEQTTTTTVASSGSSAAALYTKTYLTATDETGTLPNSRELLAGTNIAFDDTTPGERTISSTASGGITELTGDVTAGPGSGSQVATIADDAVTNTKIGTGAVSYDKIQLVTGKRLLGNPGVAPDTPNEIAVDLGLTFNGSDELSLNANAIGRTIVFTFGGGGTTPSTGVGMPIRVSFRGTIVAATILGDSPTGSAVVDIWQGTYSDYPLDNTYSICTSAKPTLTSADKDENTTLAGWSQAISADNILQANLDSISGHTWVVVILKVELDL